MLTLTRRIQRKVRDAQGRLLSLTLAPEGLYLRPYKKRTGFLLPFDAALYRAQVIAADATRVVAPRKKKRKG